MCTYDVIGGQYEVVKKKKQLTHELYSEMHPPPTNVKGESKEKFKLSQCPAYVTQTKVGGADCEETDPIGCKVEAPDQNVEYVHEVEGPDAVECDREVEAPDQTVECDREVEAPDQTVECDREVEAPDQTVDCDREVEAPDQTVECDREVEAPDQTVECDSETKAPDQNVECDREVVVSTSHM